MHYKLIRPKSFTLTTSTNSGFFKVSLLNYLNSKQIGSWWFQHCNTTVKQVMWKLSWNRLSDEEAIGSESLENIAIMSPKVKIEGFFTVIGQCCWVKIVRGFLPFGLKWVCVFFLQYLVYIWFLYFVIIYLFFFNLLFSIFWSSISIYTTI